MLSPSGPLPTARVTQALEGATRSAAAPPISWPGRAAPAAWLDKNYFFKHNAKNQADYTTVSDDLATGNHDNILRVQAQLVF